MRAISNEIREKIVIHKQNKVKEDDIAKALIISKSTVTKVWSRYNKTGSYLPSQATQGRKSAISGLTMGNIMEEIKATPDITLLELIDKFELGISECALSKKLKKLGFSYKKRQHIQQRKTVLTSKKSAKNFKNI